MTLLGHFQQAARAAENAAYISSLSGDVAAWATLAGNPVVATGATAVGGISSLFEQLVRPNWRKAAGDSMVDVTTRIASDKYPIFSPVFQRVRRTG
ncbi:hypothetical protein D3C87_1711220 [compost metagenome]